MTMNEFNVTFIETLNDYEENCGDYPEDMSEFINDFCNIHANSYEEYTAMWEILEAAFLVEEVE